MLLDEIAERFQVSRASAKRADEDAATEAVMLDEAIRKHWEQLRAMLIQKCEAVNAKIGIPVLACDETTSLSFTVKNSAYRREEDHEPDAKSRFVRLEGSIRATLRKKPRDISIDGDLSMVLSVKRVDGRKHTYLAQRSGEMVNVEMLAERIIAQVLEV